MTKTDMTRGYGLFENFLTKRRAKIANKLIPQNLRYGKILDIGCGVVPYFLITTKFKEKYGIDPSIKSFNSKENIILKKFDIEKNSKLPFRYGSFHVVTMLAVLEHIEPDKLVNIFKEIKRVLKPKGRFILTTPCPWTNTLLSFMAGLKLVSPKEIEEHKGSYNQISIIHYFDEAEFERKKMNFGYFEHFLNIWAYVDK